MSVTVRLLEHWADERGCRLRPFFAQREAVETLVWLREVATRQTAGGCVWLQTISSRQRSH